MIEIRALEPTDALQHFKSGNRDLDRWLKRNGQGNQRRFGVTYVALDASKVIGFVTVAGYSVDRQEVAGSGGPGTWPALLLGRLAVDQSRQGTGVGAALLTHVFALAAQMHYTIGCSLVVVDAKPESVGFYSKYGFLPVPQSTDAAAGEVTPVPSGQTRMFIEVKTILAAIEAVPNVPPESDGGSVESDPLVG